MSKTHRGFVARATALLVAFTLALGLGACGASPVVEAESSEDDNRCEVRVAMMETSASLGMVPLVGKARAGELSADYTFALLRGYRDAQEGLEQNMVDIAILQPAKALLSYRHTDGGLLVGSIASVADWTFVSVNKSVKSLSSLSGRTVYTTAKASAEGITLRYLLELAGLRKQVHIEYKSSESEIAAAISADATTVGILTEPALSIAKSMNPNLVSAMTLEDEWETLVEQGLVGGGSKLVGYVIVVRKAFAVAHPEVVKEFLQEYASSVEQMNIDPITYAEDAFNLGLIDDPEMCESIVGGSQLACLTGEEMQLALNGYLQMYADYVPKVIGGSMPEDGFYLVDVDALVARYEDLSSEELAAEGLERRDGQIVEIEVDPEDETAEENPEG